MDNYMSFGGHNVIFWYMCNEKLKIFRLSVITNIYSFMRTLKTLSSSYFNCCNTFLLTTLTLLYDSNGNIVLLSGCVPAPVEWPFLLPASFLLFSKAQSCFYELMYFR